MIRIAFVIVFSVLSSLVWGQIRGVVRDMSNGEPLSGASIQAESGEVAISDNDGAFSIEAPTGSLTISHVGYQTLTKAIDQGQRNLIISLKAGGFNLQEVVVTAYHDNRKLIDIPGAVALISKKDLDRDQDLIFANTINRIPGVYMHNGTLNTNRITIRGIGSDRCLQEWFRRHRW